MKKIISLVIIAAMMVFALASCGGSKKGDDDKGDDKVVRYTITAEEWAALENIKNFTLEMSGTSSYTMGEESMNSTNSRTLKSTETAMYEKYESTDGEEEYTSETYSVIKDDVRYELDQGEDEKWYASEYDWEVDSLLECVTDGTDVTFEDLTYNEEKKAYVYTVTEDGATITYTYYFEDGNLVKLEGVMSGSMDTVTMTATANMVISNIGTTTVTVPEYTIPEE